MGVMEARESALTFQCTHMEHAHGMYRPMCRAWAWVMHLQCSFQPLKSSWAYLRNTLCPSRPRDADLEWMEENCPSNNNDNDRFPVIESVSVELGTMMLQQ